MFGSPPARRTASAPVEAMRRASRRYDLAVGDQRRPADDVDAEAPGGPLARVADRHAVAPKAVVEHEQPVPAAVTRERDERRALPVVGRKDADEVPLARRVERIEDAAPSPGPRSGA